MVNIIWFLFDLNRFRHKSSVCIDIVTPHGLHISIRVFGFNKSQSLSTNLWKRVKLTHVAVVMLYTMRFTAVVVHCGCGLTAVAVWLRCGLTVVVVWQWLWFDCGCGLTVVAVIPPWLQRQFIPGKNCAQLNGRNSSNLFLAFPPRRNFYNDRAYSLPRGCRLPASYVQFEIFAENPPNITNDNITSRSLRRSLHFAERPAECLGRGR